MFLVSLGVDQEAQRIMPCLTERALDLALVQAGEDPSHWKPFHLKVRQQNDSIVIGVFGPGIEAPLIEKTLIRDGECDDLAATIAAILAASRTELPGFANEISLPAGPNVEAEPSPRPTEIDFVAKTVRYDPSKPMPASLHVAGGVTAAGATTSGTIGAMVSLRPTLRAPVELDFGLRYNALAQTPLGTGLASWERWTAMAVVAAMVKAGPGQIRIFAGPQVSLLGVRGRGYVENRQASSFDAGAAAGTQVVLGRGSLRPCLGLQVNRWFGRQDLSLRGANDRESVPRWDFFASVGLFFSVR
ncbi:MAG: hypothetical protein SF187_09390 [Deltaproteobacteria bacterium]|nr:hypothetical protein [Deltaproteobacteria bacterium]